MLFTTFVFYHGGSFPCGSTHTFKTGAAGPLCPRPEEKHLIFSCCDEQIQPCDTRSWRSPMSVSLLVPLQFRFCLLVTGPSLCFGLCRGVFTRRWDLSDSLPAPHPPPRPQDNMAGVFSSPHPPPPPLWSCPAASSRGMTDGRNRAQMYVRADSQTMRLTTEEERKVQRV